MRFGQAQRWATLVTDRRTAGIQRTVKLTGAPIAATAIEHGLPVTTQDDDYSRRADVRAALSVVTV